MKIARDSIQWIISILIFFFILMTSIRILLTPLYLKWEYHKASFPPDTYGFTTEDRLYYAKFSVDYLINNEDISYIGDLTLADGSSLFNNRELSHMVDVKNLVKLGLKLWYAAFFIIVIFILLLIIKRNYRDIFIVAQRGAYITIGFIIFVLISVGISFSALFTGFHKIFFEGETWIFLYSDSLIRLFPMQFWQDAFFLLGVISLFIAIIIIVACKFSQSNKKMTV